MIELDKDLITLLDSHTFHYGTLLEVGANDELQNFISKYKDYNYNDEQINLITKRKKKFQDFIEKNYNDYLKAETDYILSKVNGKDFKKNADVARKMKIRIEKQIKKFYENTDEMLKNAYSKGDLKDILEKYRNGYNEPISDNDPNKKYKLQARLEFLTIRHQKYEDFNRKARKNGGLELEKSILIDSNNDIRKIKNRLRLLEKNNESPKVNYSEFDMNDYKELTM